MHLRFISLGVVVAAVTLACSDSESSPAGQGGGATSTGAGGTSATGTGGAGAGTCGLFDGSTCVGFIDGCWAPDLSGTCTDGATELSWSDGHKIVRVGAGPGLYGPGDTTPCVAVTFDAATSTATLTNASGDTLLNKDLGDGNIQITCPGGDEYTYSAAELEADNVCKGISCG